ncbi:aminotransferase class I/II-fold pyridoxal phosphate-dependent enzyme [Streptomyces sp. TP-A0874]|uniref:aminotransferase class I/II-fold pyridoxal phosphate-dependent enzyme n=1 Tax=Streptomyces sp. TP-A0874 TaxID=549819 RepID=UPI00085396CA|nr:aminotransferase class I/II-fold pyridoxal phosphate-dependent enzyme [Streptomyces sp. TP-A0874]
MQRTAPGVHRAHQSTGSFGPPTTAPGLPVLPELAACLAGAAGDAAREPVGGGPRLLDAVRGYWCRRGLHTDVPHVAAAPGAEPLLLALLLAIGGDVLLTRPCAAWYAPQALTAGRPAYHLPTPAECGGVPDPVAFRETVRRIRAEGGDPRVLVLSVADDPCGTVPPPELVRDACEAAADEGLWIVSDETYRDAVHAPEETVLASPAELRPEHTVVLADLGAATLPPGWPAAIARFPATARGGTLRTAVLRAGAGLRAEIPGPIAAAVTYALGDPPAVSERRAAANRMNAGLATAVHRVLLAAGALSRPPAAGDQLYADLEPLRPALARRGVTDSVELEAHFSRLLGTPVPGGHRFGDAPDALRLRLSAGPLAGTTREQRMRALTAAEPLTLAHVEEALAAYESAFTAADTGTEPPGDQTERSRR